jgi:hypothetical protein
VPPPITTIAWRVGHIAGMALGGFASRMFGDGTLTIDDLAFPSTAAEASAFCDSHYRAWRDGMATVAEARWWQPLGAVWGPYRDSPTVDGALHVLDELVHHGSEPAARSLRPPLSTRDRVGPVGYAKEAGDTPTPPASLLA